MTRRPQHIHHRGLTLLELMIALTITALVGAAIAGMLGVVSTGIMVKQDVRSTMVRGNIAQIRLVAYIAPSACVLESDGQNLVIWLEDSRDSDTVHGSEIRWLLYDATNDTYDVYFVSFPESWTEIAKALEDDVHPMASDWASVLASYDAQGYIARVTLVDGVASVDVTLDEATPTDATHVSFRLTFDTQNDPTTVHVASTIRDHEVPAL